MTCEITNFFEFLLKLVETVKLHKNIEFEILSAGSFQLPVTDMQARVSSQLSVILY